VEKKGVERIQVHFFKNLIQNKAIEASLQ
jgi:hypothetical protein